jgi:hypothetical protein
MLKSPANSDAGAAVVEDEALELDVAVAEALDDEADGVGAGSTNFFSEEAVAGAAGAATAGAFNL